MKTFWMRVELLQDENAVRAGGPWLLAKEFCSAHPQERSSEVPQEKSRGRKRTSCFFSSVLSYIPAWQIQALRFEDMVGPT